MNHLVIDVETTTFQKGNPFARRNECCYIGYGTDCGVRVLRSPFSKGDLEELRDAIRGASVIVAFNAKFDLHWLTRLGVTEWRDKQVWDLQIGEFLLSGQQTVMPSLDVSLQRFQLPEKYDVVKKEYWEQGIDTPDIPEDVMRSYTTQDVRIESLLYAAQRTAFSGDSKMLKLAKLCNKDMLVLQEMEYNGQRFNTEKALLDAQALSDEAAGLLCDIRRRVGIPRFNPGSTDHLSAVLFGGVLTAKWKVPYLVTRKGEERIGFKHFESTHRCERLVQPSERFKLKKEGLYSVSADHLATIKPTKRVARLLEQIARLGSIEKLVGTYLRKIPVLIDEMDWPKDTVHGQFNQCVVVTGRLSSSKPNRQNEPKEVALYFETKYR